jgi:hypothetical protein
MAYSVVAGLKDPRLPNLPCVEDFVAQALLLALSNAEGAVHTRYPDAD